MPDPLTFPQFKEGQSLIADRYAGIPRSATVYHQHCLDREEAALEFIRQALPHLRAYRRELVTKAHDAGFDSELGRVIMNGWVARLDRLLETYP